MYAEQTTAMNFEKNMNMYRFVSEEVTAKADNYSLI